MCWLRVLFFLLIIALVILSIDYILSNDGTGTCLTILILAGVVILFTRKAG